MLRYISPIMQGTDIVTAKCYYYEVTHDVTSLMTLSDV